VLGLSASVSARQFSQNKEIKKQYVPPLGWRTFLEFKYGPSPSPNPKLKLFDFT